MMAIITISRGSLSGGANLARLVAQELDYQCLSREALLESASERYGVEFQQLADTLEKPPSIWERVTKGPRVYLAVLRATLLESAAGGQIVYHGHAGHFLMAGVVCVLRTRLIAPFEMRVQAAMESKQMSRQSAEQHIRDVDEVRIRWTKYLYDVDWNDPMNFDITINLANVHMQSAKDLICHMASQKAFQISDACALKLKNLCLAAHVQALLALNRETQTLDVQVESNDGMIRLSGAIESEKLRSAVLEVVNEVGEIKGVQDELVVESLSRIPT